MEKKNDCVSDNAPQYLTAYLTCTEINKEMNIGNPIGFRPVPHVPISFEKVYFFRLRQTRVHFF